MDRMDPDEHTGHVHLLVDEEELVEVSAAEDDRHDTVSLGLREPGRSARRTVTAPLHRCNHGHGRQMSKRRTVKGLRDLLLRRTLRGGSDEHGDEHDSAVHATAEVRGEAEGYYNATPSLSTDAPMHPASPASLSHPSPPAPTPPPRPMSGPVNPHGLTEWPLGPPSLKPGVLPTTAALRSTARGDRRFLDDTAERYELLRRFDGFVNKGLSGQVSKLALRKWEPEAISEEMMEILPRARGQGDAERVPLQHHDGLKRDLG